MSIEEDLKKKFDQEVAENTTVNIMVTGGTGVGKSSLINTIFGEKIAPEGSGKPVTKGVEKYKHSNFPIIIYDTEGYEIIDGTTNNNFKTNIIEKIKELQKSPLKDQIHLFWYCLSATNHRITKYDLDNIKLLAGLGIDLAIVITKCDEEEIDENGKGKVSQKFKEELIAADIKNAVYETMTIGKDTLELNKLIEWSSQSLKSDDLKRAFIGAQIKNISLKDEEANKIVLTAAAAAGATGGFNPVPLSDSAVIMPIQMAMAIKLAKIYGADNLGEHALTLLRTQLLSLVGKQLAASLTKFIPGIGQIINSAVATGITTSLGYALQNMYRSAYLEYLETGKKPDWVHLFEAIDLTEIFKNWFKKGS